MASDSKPTRKGSTRDRLIRRVPGKNHLRVGSSAPFQQLLVQILSLYFKPKMPLFGHKDGALTFFVVIRPVSNLAGL